MARERGSARCGVVLNPTRAAEIYMQKAALLAPDQYPSCLTGPKIKGQSVHIGQKYNVSAKTIRDIWNRRTWTFATCHLWHIAD